jgi:hypothetical protein
LQNIFNGWRQEGWYRHSKLTKDFIRECGQSPKARLRTPSFGQEQPDPTRLKHENEHGFTVSADDKIICWLGREGARGVTP